MDAMWLMIQQDKPDDFVVATGQSYSVSEFLQEAFSCLDPNCSEDVKIDPRFWGPGEVDVQQGDAFKA